MVARLAKVQYQLAPRVVEWGLARFIEGYLRQAQPAPITHGNLDAPMPERAALHGGWRRSRPRVWNGGALAIGLAGLVAAGAYVAASRRQR